MTFIAPINAIRYNGAEPIFMDNDDFYTIDINKTIDFINNETRKVSGATVNKRTGKKISAIVIVHVFGNAVKLNDLQAICKKRNIVLIEDAAESVGTFYTTGRYKKKHTGIFRHLSGGL